MKAWSVVQSAALVDSGAGSRFRIVSEPAGRDIRGTVVFVHAFAEEMNKSRRMAARTARALAGAGWRVVQRDLCGCGDSAGDFADASWAAWADDVADELSQAAAGRPVWLWCQRAGALLATAASARHPEMNLLLWQPVLSGAQHLQQFLRLHAGARIVGSAKGEGGPSPVQLLRSGVAVEVGGYRLSPALATGFEQAAFDVPAAFAGRLVWLEVSPDDAPELSLPAAHMVERLQARGIRVEPEVVRGPPFWQTQEIEDCDALIERTLERLCADPRAGVRDPGDAGVRRVALHEVSR